MNYIPIVWQNLPLQTTPMDAQSLNHMEEGIKAANDDVNKNIYIYGGGRILGTINLDEAEDGDYINLPFGENLSLVLKDANGNTLGTFDVIYDGSFMSGANSLYLSVISKTLSLYDQFNSYLTDFGPYTSQDKQFVLPRPWGSYTWNNDSPIVGQDYPASLCAFQFMLFTNPVSYLNIGSLYIYEEDINTGQWTSTSNYGPGDEFRFAFTTDTTGCTLVLPNGVTWFGGSAPTLQPDTYYEVTIRNNHATILS